MSVLIFGIKRKHPAPHPLPPVLPLPLPSSIKHLKGSPIRNGSRNAQLTPNYPTGVVGHRVITFTTVPFKTRLFMYSHFAAVRAFMVSGASVKAATIKSSIAYSFFTTKSSEKTKWNESVLEFFFLFFLFLFFSRRTSTPDI